MNRRDDRPLSIRQANCIAGRRVRVSADTVTPSLWRVEDDEAIEVHEPTTASAWLAFLSDWVR